MNSTSKTALLVLICTLLLSFMACKQPDNGTNQPNNPDNTKDHLVENEDYIDLTSSYDGKSFNYNESMWYMNLLKDVPLPDPHVYVEDGTYYIVGTSDRDVNVVDCYVTTDFVTYEPHYAIYNPCLYDGDRKSTRLNSSHAT